MFIDERSMTSSKRAHSHLRMEGFAQQLSGGGRAQNCQTRSGPVRMAIEKKRLRGRNFAVRIVDAQVPIDDIWHLVVVPGMVSYVTNYTSRKDIHTSRTCSAVFVLGRSGLLPIQDHE